MYHFYQLSKRLSVKVSTLSLFEFASLLKVDYFATYYTHSALVHFADYDQLSVHFADYDQLSVHFY